MLISESVGDRALKIGIGKRNIQHSYIPMQNTAGNFQIPRFAPVKCKLVTFSFIGMSPELKRVLEYEATDTIEESETYRLWLIERLLRIVCKVSKPGKLKCYTNAILRTGFHL